MCRFPFGSDSFDGLWRMTLGTELAGHRYPDSPRRIQVLRCRRALHRHGYWLRAALRRNRHDNPVSRVSTALSAESHQSRRNPGIRCAATLLAASRTFERSLLDLRSWAVPPTAKDPPTRIHGFANSAPNVRCNDHTREAGDVERKGLSSILQPPTDRRGRDPMAVPSPVDRAEPSHHSVSNPVKDPVRNPPTAGQRQRQRTRTPPPRRQHPKEENIEMATK
jgi:hypothetical protein